MTRYAPRDLDQVEPFSYTVPQAAKAVGRSVTRIKQLIKAGRLTAVRDGPRVVMIERAELERWVRELPAVVPAKKLSQDVK
jgi:excisionase family DNA binding protein